MAIGVQLNAQFLIDGTTYSASMSLPTSAPTATNPFLFYVTSKGTTGTENDLLTVAVGTADQIYVAVAPPQDLIAKAAGDIVQQLNVVVSEGNYNTSTHQFTTTPTPPPPPPPAV